MTLLIVITYYLIQITITYLIGRVVMRIGTGDWIRDDYHMVYYIVGCFTLIPILGLIILVLKCVG